MKATLFEGDIDTYAAALKMNGEYELSGVTVRPLREEYRARPDEEFQLTLGGRMRVKTLNVSGCNDGPKFQALANIPTELGEHEPFLGSLTIFVLPLHYNMESFSLAKMPVFV